VPEKWGGRMPIKSVLFFPGSSLAEAVFQLLWAPVAAGACTMIATYWNWFAFQNALVEAALISAFTACIFVLYFVPRLVVKNRSFRIESHRDAVKQYLVIKNWAEHLLIDLGSDMTARITDRQYLSLPGKVTEAANELIVHSNVAVRQIHPIPNEFLQMFIWFEATRKQFENRKDLQASFTIGVMVNQVAEIIQTCNKIQSILVITKR
jgi:hypothetical protein